MTWDSKATKVQRITFRTENFKARARKTCAFTWSSF